MSSSFVASLAGSHFAASGYGARPNQALLAGIAVRINPKNLLNALCSCCRPVQDIAWQRLVDFPEGPSNHLIQGGLADAASYGSERTLALLRSLTHDAVSVSDEIITYVFQLIGSNDPQVRRAAASVVSLRRPGMVRTLLRERLSQDVLREFCRAEDPDLIIPLMTEFGFPSKAPPPTIGFLVTSNWLAEQFSEHPAEVEWLARECGYCDDSITPESLNLLAEGFAYVSGRMTNAPRMNKIAHIWERRIRSFVWHLLPNELDLEHDDQRLFDVNSPLDVDLFLAAVRDIDRLIYQERKSLRPFSHEAMQREPAPVCFHASSRFVRRIFLEQPRRLAAQWDVTDDRQGEFLIDHARVLLEPNEDLRVAADRALRGKWIAEQLSAKRPVVSRKQKNRPVPVRSLVIGDFSPPDPDPRLSPGANSIVSLTSACGGNSEAVASWLHQAESQWSNYLVPMGIEVQIPQVDPDYFAAWKDALPFLGVRSPIRPEFRGMLEASFRPGRSFHSMALGPLLLEQLKIIQEPQDMALHVSLQGTFDDRLRYIAFPHFFLNPSKRLRDRPDWSMARVMSKGFAHVHDDAEPLQDSPAATRRTELRVLRILAESDATPTILGEGVAHDGTTLNAKPSVSIKLVPTFIGDLISLQILGSALASGCERCQLLFDEYATDVQQFVRSLPAEFEILLRSNLYESSGDPRDVQLLNQLPVFRAWSAVRQVIRSQELSSSLNTEFGKLRNRHVGKLLTHLSEQHDLASPEVTITDSASQLAVPEQLFQQRHQEE